MQASHLRIGFHFNANRKIQFNFLFGASKMNCAVVMDMKTEARSQSPMCMSEYLLLAMDPSSLKYIQIESVIFLACNYFHIIYRFSRAQKQKLKNIVKFMPYIRRTDGVRKTFTWDQMNKFQVS